MNVISVPFNQISRIQYPVRPYTTSSKYPVHIWLPTHKLLEEFSNDTDQEILDECLKSIIKIYGNSKQIIKHLVDTSNEEQLTKIYDILKNNRLQSEEYVHCNENKAASHFNMLSTESISHICSYLNRYDIKCLKLTCSLLGIICINEMRKIKIGAINFNEILIHKQYKYLTKLSQFSTHKLIKYNSYSPSMKCATLLQLWQKQYNIQINDMILFKIVDDGLLSTEQPIHKLSHSHFRQISPTLSTISHVPLYANDNDNGSLKSNNSVISNYDNGIKFLYSLTNHVAIISYMDKLEDVFNIKDIKGGMKSVIIFDKQKIRLLNNNIPKQITKNDYILILNYFDISTQQIEFLQLFCVHETDYVKDLSNFIQNNFDKLLSKFEINENVKNIINDFEAQTIILCSDLKLFKFYEFETDDTNYETITQNTLTRRLLNSNLISQANDFYNTGNNIKIFIFQINDEFLQFNEYLHKTQRIYENKYLKPYYLDAQDFMCDQSQIKKKFKLSYCSNISTLKSKLKYFYSLKNTSENSDLIDDILTENNHPKIFNIELDITPLTSWGLVRRIIASKLKNIIPVNNIEIYNKSQHSVKGYGRKAWNSVVGEIDQYEYKNKKHDWIRVSFGITLYNTEIIENNYTLYRIRIFLPCFGNEVILPKTPYILNMKYFKYFVVKDFVNELVNKISHALFSKKYIKILTYFEDNNNNRYGNGNYSIMISNYSDYNSCYNCLDINEEFGINNDYNNEYNDIDIDEQKTNNFNDDLDRDIYIETIDTFIVKKNEYNNTQLNEYNNNNNNIELIVRFRTITNDWNNQVGRPQIIIISINDTINTLIRKLIKNDVNKQCHYGQCHYIKDNNIDQDVTMHGIDLIQINYNDNIYETMMKKGFNVLIVTKHKKYQKKKKSSKKTFAIYPH